MNAPKHALEVAKNVIDGGALAVWVGWVTDYLPAVATVLTVIWAGYRIYDIRLSIKEKKIRINNAKAG